jgi:hypothetical protein
MKSITKYTADHAHRFFGPTSIVCTVCMSGIQHALLNYQIITLCTYIHSLLKGHCINKRIHSQILKFQLMLYIHTQIVVLGLKG